MNGQPLADSTLTKEILLDYATNSILDDDSTYDLALPDLASELQAVTENPAFQDVALNERLAGLLSGKSSQSEQALAAILTDQTSARQYLSPLLDALFTKKRPGRVTMVRSGLARMIAALVGLTRTAIGPLLP